MFRVVLRQNAAYRWDDGDYVQVCTVCAMPRAGRAERCQCGARFPKEPRKFFIRSRELPTLSPRFPSTCPHCGEECSRTTTISRDLHTSRHSKATLIYELPVCKRYRHPLLYFFVMIGAAFVFVVAGLYSTAALLSAEPEPLALTSLVPPGLLGYWAYHKYTCIRMPSWGQGQVVFAVRRRDYAHELARLNRGYVRGLLRH